MQPIGGVDGVSGVGGIGTGYVSTVGAVTKNSEARATTPEEKADEGAEEVRQKKRLGVIECETCANRTYQDGSDDPGVSFKAPTKMSPNEAATAVPSHEREHYNREQAKATQEDMEVLSNSIRIFMSVCPECGRTYVSGGLTTTVTKSNEKSQEEDMMAKLFGAENGDEEKDPNSVYNVNKKIANAAFGLNYDEKQ